MEKPGHADAFELARFVLRGGAEHKAELAAANKRAEEAKAALADLRRDTARKLEREREACIHIYEHYFDLPKQAISRACAREKVRERAAMSEEPEGD